MYRCSLVLAFAIALTGCLECEEDLTTTTDDPTITDPTVTVTDTTDPTDTTDTGTTTDTTDTVTVEDLAPTVTIRAPQDGSQIVYDDYDQQTQLWYVDVELSGVATDPEDGTLSGTSMVWTTDRTDMQDADLGTGDVTTVRLFSDDCFGITHEITLTATDSAGNAVSETVSVFIYTLC